MQRPEYFDEVKWSRMVDRWHDYTWEVIHEKPQGAFLHAALDEVLVEEVAAGNRGPTIRFWEWSESGVIIGRFQSVKNEVEPEAAARHNMHIVRRITGGGAMFVEPLNTLTYSIYAPEDLVKGMSFVESYAFLDSWVVAAFRELGVDAYYEPINDIAQPGGKIGGAAQTRKNGAVLHHATIAFDIDANKMVEVLRIGKEKLSDKGSVSAKKRVAPLKQQLQMERAEAMAHLITSFTSQVPAVPSTLTDAELGRAERLAEEKFASPEWQYLLP